MQWNEWQTRTGEDEEIMDLRIAKWMYDESEDQDIA